MKKNYKIEGTYQISGNQEIEFSIKYDNLLENEENNKQLLKLLYHPWKLIKEGGKLGVNGVKRFFTVMTLFAVSNFIAFIYAIITLLSSDFSVSKLFYLVLILIIGIACTVYATYRTYQFVIIATMEVLYKNLSSFFEKISELIIDKVEHLLKGTNRLSSEKLKSALDLRKMINSRYQKAPSFLKKGIILILNRIPFAAMLLDLQDDILNGKKVEASKKLYIKMDDFISNILFGNNNTKWIYWLLPLNIFAVILLIKFKIG